MKIAYHLNNLKQNKFSSKPTSVSIANVLFQMGSRLSAIRQKNQVLGKKKKNKLQVLSKNKKEN